MVYDYEAIGNRIKAERKSLGKNQEELAEDLGAKRSTVGSWENGLTMPSFQKMIKLCEMFDCEMGYLLCEEGYEGKTRKATDICKETGLSQQAVIKLCESKKQAEWMKSKGTLLGQYFYKIDFPYLINDFILNSHDLVQLLMQREMFEEQERMLKSEQYCEQIKQAYRKTEKEKGVIFNTQDLEDARYATSDNLSELLQTEYKLAADIAEKEAERLIDKYYEILTPIYKSNCDFTISRIMMKFIDDTISKQADKFLQDAKNEEE